MAQFDVLDNPRTETRAEVPYLVDLQSELFGPLATRVVAPLRLIEQGTPYPRTLMPVFEVQGQKVVLAIPELVGLSRGELGAPIDSLAEHRDEIVAALDMLFLGI